MLQLGRHTEIRTEDVTTRPYLLEHVVDSTTTNGRYWARTSDPACRDDLLGDRFWGQVQGSSGRLKALRGKGRRAVELAMLQGKRTTKRCSLAVSRRPNSPW